MFKEAVKRSCEMLTDHSIWDISLGHSLYCKPTYTDCYLKGNSYHRPAQKEQKVINFSAQGLFALGHTELTSELLHL